LKQKVIGSGIKSLTEKSPYKASVRSRRGNGAGRDRDLIEAGLSEPAGWPGSYGDYVCAAPGAMYAIGWDVGRYRPADRDRRG
jgi:hypothetical protein